MSDERNALPSWVKEIRPHQTVAVAEVIAAFDDGAQLVFIDAPTGSGKTLIGELVRRETNYPRVLYVCSDKTLQDQFARDFPYAKVLKGKANYPTEYGPADMTCDDCTADSPADPCMWCNSTQTCPYQVAKRIAAEADLAVINTSYLLTEANYVGVFSRYDLIIVDECDTLERMLMGFVEFKVPRYVARALKLVYPIKGAHKPTLRKWIEQVAADAERYERSHRMKLSKKERARWSGFATTAKRTCKELDVDIAKNGDDEDTGKWLRDYDTDTFSLKPVMRVRVVRDKVYPRVLTSAPRQGGVRETILRSSW